MSSSRNRPPFEAVKAFRAKIEARDPPMGPLISLTDPRVTDAMGWGDKVDFIWYDQEHAPMSPEALQNHILAAHGRGIAVIVRVQGPNVVTGQTWGGYIKAALDAGADGVIVPQVRTAEEVRSIVADCRYPRGPTRLAPYNTIPEKGAPAGTASASWLKRGFSTASLNSSGLPLYEYLNEADEAIFCCIMLETAEVTI